MTTPIINSFCISDSFCKKHSEAVAKIEQIRLMKGRELPYWPYWCFLPVSHWMRLFMSHQQHHFTKELYLEMQKRLIPGTRHYSKGIYSPHPALMRALTDTPMAWSLVREKR